MSPARRLVDVFVDHPKIDYVATAVVVGAVVWIAPEGLIAPTEHGSLYQTLASVSGILLSLGTIIITLVFTVTPNDRLTMIVDSVGDRLLRLVMSSLGMLVITTVGFMTLYALDGHRVPRLGVLTSLTSLMALRFARLWWLIAQVLRALMTGMREDMSQPWCYPLVGTDDYKVRGRRLRRTPVSDMKATAGSRPDE